MTFFWLILIVAVIGITFWYLKSRKKGVTPTPPAPTPEEEKKEGPEV